MFRQRLLAQKLVCRCVQAGAQLVRTSFPAKAPLIGPIHFAPMAFPIHFPTQTSLLWYHSCFDQFSGRGFATSNGEEPNGEKDKQEGKEDKKWWSKTTQKLGRIISAAAERDMGYHILYYKPLVSLSAGPKHTYSQNKYPISLFFRYKDLIELDWEKANEFFNREGELSYLEKILVDERKSKDTLIHVMLGFNKCGKTTLINHFLANHYPDDAPPYVYIHLKEKQIGSMEEFL